MRKQPLHTLLGLCWAVVLLSGLAGCAAEQAATQVKDGQEYGVTSSQVWRGRWWNYYERGSSYAAGAFWNEARRDLQEAIKQRGEDQRRARTYGLHFVDYFPHRELGVVYYGQGRYNEAIRELETSLRQAETAKAKFYLNKARRGQIEQSQGDTTPPQIVFADLPDGLLTRAFTLPVRGQVTDNTYVSAISVQGQPQFIEVAEPQVSFSHEVTLHDGVNMIEMVAVDLLGNLTRQQRTVILDRQGPLVSLSRVEALAGAGRGAQVRVEGLCSDSHGVARFVLAGQPLPLPAGQDSPFRTDIILQPGVTSLAFEATDTAGNVTRGTLALAPSQTLSQGHPKARWAAWRALLNHHHANASGPLTLFPVTWQPAPLRLAQRPDSATPTIKFTNLAAQQTTYYDAVYLEGQASDATAITALRLNGENLLRREGQQVFFGYNAMLQPGENRFVVEATNKQGQTTKQEAVVQRKVAEVKRLDARLRLSLLPLEKKGSGGGVAEAVYDQFLTALLNQERFQIVEREQIEAILREQKLAQTALVEADTAAKIGKIAAADGIIVGSVTEMQNSLEVFVRYVDVETGEVVATEDVYGEELTLRTLRPLMEGLALKMRQRFPLVQGLVLKTDAQKVFVDLGNKQIKKYMKLLIFREGESIKHPVTGQVLGAPTEVVGEIKVEAVFDDLAQGALRPQKTPVEIKQLDKVITK
ncbi:MAG: CsgG/HfaB family protein [Candidatus Tectimicrobiota bacterium]